MFSSWRYVKLGGLSLVGMGDEEALVCGACWEQYEGRCSPHGGMSETGRSQFGGDGDEKALICGGCWEQYKRRCSLHGGMSETGRSQFGWDGGEKALICGACWEQYKGRCSLYGDVRNWEVSVWWGLGMRKHSFVVHAGSNTRGGVLFMEVCQKLGGLSLVGMGGCESTHLWCMLEAIQGEMFSSWRYVRNWEVSVWWGWVMRRHSFVVHAGSNTRGDVLFMEVCQKLGGLRLMGMGGVRKHSFVVHAGSNTRGDVLFMEVCQKLGGLSLVGMRDDKALICGACWKQYKGRCSLHGGVSVWEVSVWLGWGMRKHSFVVHAGSNTRGDVLFMEVCQSGRSLFGWDGG